MKDNLIYLFEADDRSVARITMVTFLFTFAGCALCGYTGASLSDLPWVALGVGAFFYLAQILIYCAWRSPEIKYRDLLTFKYGRSPVLKIGACVVIALAIGGGAPKLKARIINKRTNAVTSVADQNSVKALRLSRDLIRLSADTDAPEAVWQDAAKLITFRSPVQPQAPMQACPRSYADGEPPTSPDSGIRIVTYLHDCEYHIDDPGLSEMYITETKKLRSYHGFNIPPEMIFVHIVLNRVRIVYGGGPIIASSIQMHECTFDFRFSSEPTSEGRRMVSELLLASNLSSVKEIALRPDSFPTSQ